jgi:hypothetical protein
MSSPRLQGSKNAYSPWREGRSGDRSLASTERKKQTPEQEYPKRERRNYEPDEYEQEHAELIQRIIKSAPLKKSSDGRKLLAFLWENRRYEIDGVTLELYFYRDVLDRGFSPHRGRAKTQLSSLRGRLGEYFTANPREKWRCVLPEKGHTEDQTYLLEFSPAPVVLESAPIRFWEPHLSRVTGTEVVTGVHHFFYSEKRGLVIRLPFFEVERDWKNEVILEKVSSARPDIDFEGFEPWQNTYLAFGDIEGYEALNDFFRETAHVSIPRKTSATISLKDIRKKSPIIFGRPQTNPYIRELFADVSDKPGKAKELGFQMHDTQGTIKINGIRPKEVEDLELKGLPISLDGVIGPITKMRKVFCIVSRFRYPGSDAPVTMFACDYYSPIIARIVRALTVPDEAQKIFAKLDWSNLISLPDTFELLFAVDRLKGDIPDESSPELITWRIP